MHPTIRYHGDTSKAAPHVFIIEESSDGNVWLPRRPLYRRAVAEQTLQRIRTNGMLARMEMI